MLNTFSFKEHMLGKLFGSDKDKITETLSYPDKGVIYSITGKEMYFREAAYSITSLKKYNPGIHVTLFTENKKFKCEGINSYRYIPNDIHPLKLKVRGMMQSPYKQTLFLDSDILVLDEITELFDFLKDTHFALAPNPKWEKDDDKIKYIPGEGKIGFNTGFVLYRNDSPSFNYLVKWYDFLMAQDESDMWPGHNCDQWHFNKLYSGKNLHRKMGVDIQILDHEVWNVRHHAFNYLIESGLQDKIKVAHDHRIFNDDSPWPFFNRFLKKNVKYKYEAVQDDKPPKQTL